MHIPKIKNKIVTFGLMTLMTCANLASNPKTFQRMVKDTLELTNKEYKPSLFEKIADYSSELFLNLFYKNHISSPQDVIKNLEGVERNVVIKDGKKYYKVYYGEVDKAADNAARKNKKKKKLPNLLTVGYGHTGRGFISLSGGKKAKLGDLISERQIDSLFNADLQEREKIFGSIVKKELKQHQKTAILSYIFNINPVTLCKSDTTRKIADSFFECINKDEIGKAQSKFNIITSGGVEKLGLIKRRIVEMVIFGNGRIDNDLAAQESFADLVKKLNAKGTKQDTNDLWITLKKNGISTKRIEKLKNKMQSILRPQN